MTGWNTVLPLSIAAGLVALALLARHAARRRDDLV
jgi:hypothetical protein